MKHAHKIFLIMLIFILLVSTIGCNANYCADTVNYNNNTYELCENDFSVYGNTFKSEGFLCYGPKNSPIFVKENSFLFDEGLVYHLISDDYPNISQLQLIEKISLTNGNIVYEVESKYFNSFSKLLSFNDMDNELIKKADNSANMWFIEIYYKDYPAYQTTWMIVESNNDIGVMYCSNATNTSMFGENNMYVINGDLGIYIKSLIQNS